MSAGAAALRIARRDARKALGRSLLIAIMVALPVAGAGFLDVMLRTVEVNGAEKIPLQLGRAADARILSASSGNPVLQRPDDTYGTGPSMSYQPGEQPQEPAALAAVDPRTLLPTGTRIITDEAGQLQVRTRAGLARAQVRELDYTDPLAQGLVTQLDGRAPRSTDEVAVTPRLLDVLDYRIGDTLEITSPARTLTIVGTVRPVSDRDGASVAITRPGAVLEALPEQQRYRPADLLIDTPQPFTWDQVKALNTRGITAFARQPVQDPPPRPAIPYYADPNLGSPGGNAQTIAAVALIIGLIVLEVVLLAGAAFAVGTRRQSRALGLLAATGGTSRQVRSVVLAQGLVLGAVGGGLGLATGVAASYVAIPLLNSRFEAFLPSPDLRPVELLAFVGIGIVTGLLAAVLPARTAARQDVVAALSGRRGVVATRRRYPIIGLVTAAVGAALALSGGALSLAGARAENGGRNAGLYAGMILAGTVLTQLGLIVATPAIIGATARLGRFLPLPPRLALRDAARHRGRSAPAVAAILGAVAGAVTLTLFVASQSDYDRRNYQPQLGYGQAFVSTVVYPGQPPGDPEQILSTISRVAPPDRTTTLTSFPTASCEKDCQNVSIGTPEPNVCPYAAIGERTGEVTPEVFKQYEDDPRCQGRNYSSRFSGPVIGSYDDLVALSGIRSEAAKRALDAGGMVVFDRNQVLNGKGLLKIERFERFTENGPAPVREVSVPAVYVDPAGRSTFLSGFVSPQAAASTGVPTGAEGTILSYNTLPSDNTEEAVRAALADVGEDSFFEVERGYRDAYGIGLLALLVASAVVTLGAAGVATGLAQADARADLATLAAVGAAPRVRRVLTAFQAAVIAGLGAVLGTVSGFVPMLAYLYADTEFRVVIPWLNLLGIAVVVPAVAALLAGLLTRSRLPLSRRLAT